MRGSRSISGYGNTIKEKRTEAGLSQKDLAFKVGISQSNLCLIEKGKINLTEEEFNAINEILNIKEDKAKAPKKRARKIKDAIGQMVEEVLNTKNLDKIVNEAVEETVAELDKEEKELLSEEDQKLSDFF